MPVATRRSSARTRSSKKAPRPSGGARALAVWVSLLGTMTVVGGLLLLLDGRPVPRLDGRSLSALSASATRETDPLFNTRQPLDTKRWDSIVIHHSGSTYGSAATIGREHQARNAQGLGHHFIIGNGNGMDDGQIHIGYRWLDQRRGDHAAGKYAEHLNEHAISICLVGDGNRRPFTPAQLQRLTDLIESLRKQLNIPADRVYLHSSVAEVSDPGRLFPTSLYRVQPAARER